MTEQELFEKMNQWARIHGIPLDAREGKIKEEELLFALPVEVGLEAGNFDKLYPPSCNTPARSKILDEILSPPAAGEKPVEQFDTVYRVIDGKLRRTSIPKRLDSLSKEEILASLAAEESLGHKLVPGMRTPDFLPPTLIPPGACRSKEGRIIPPPGGSGTARPVPLSAKPSFDGPFGKWLHQLWNNPAENWRDILVELTQTKKQENIDLWKKVTHDMTAAHAEELRKVREDLEKICKERTRKAVAAALTNLTRESFEEIQKVLKCAHSLGKNIEPDFFRARLGLDPATGEYVSSGN